MTIRNITNTTTASHIDDDLLTVQEVARQLRVDVTTVRGWIHTQTLDAVALPHKGARTIYRIRRSTLEHILQSTVQHVPHHHQEGREQ